MSLEKAKASLEALQRYVEQEQFRGYDPYDALNSPLLRALSLNLKYGRIAWTQALKRCPVNLRPLLGIPKEWNMKGVGLFLWGYSKLYQLDNHPAVLEKINFLIEILDKNKSSLSRAAAWGYPFPWQSRAFNLPKGMPTIVNTSFIGLALLDAYEATRNEKALELALATTDFYLKELNIFDQNEKGICFSYTPIDHTRIHNANLLGASFLLRLSKYGGESLLKIAKRALDYSMGYQNPDGSWYYADTDFQKWVDSFHTGFVLQSLKCFLDNAQGLEYQENFQRGLRFYTSRFFLEDGTSKYYHDQTFPVDIHAPAQAVVFLSSLGEEYRGLVDKILGRMIQDFQDKKGCFYFQKSKFFTNRISYMRWAQSWAFHALTAYCYAYDRKPVSNP